MMEVQCASMKRKLLLIGAILKKYWYLLLLTAAGGVAICESIRLTNKYQPKNWLAGTSGFIMILGLALAALLAFELLGRLVRAARQKQTRTAAQETADRNESKSETAATPTAEEEANASSSNRRMWLSFGLLVVYTLLIQVLGFAVSSALYLGANLLLLKNSWKSTILTTAVVLVFLLFGAPYLGISFPRGLFGF